MMVPTQNDSSMLQSPNLTLNRFAFASPLYNRHSEAPRGIWGWELVNMSSLPNMFEHGRLCKGFFIAEVASPSAHVLSSHPDRMRDRLIEQISPVVEGCFIRLSVPRRVRGPRHYRVPSSCRIPRKLETSP